MSTMQRGERVNLTLSVHERLLKEARKAAADLGTSVNELIRQYLEDLVRRRRQERSSSLDEWRRLMDENPVAMPQRSWTRDQLHER